MSTPACCPSCSHALAKVPTRRGRCPHCGALMLMKSSPNDPPGVKRLVGEDEAAQIDALWAAQNAERRDALATERVAASAARLEQILSTPLPRGLVLFAHRMHAPLRHGDLVRLIQAGERREWTLVADLEASQLVHLAVWPPEVPTTDADEGAIWRTLVDHSSVFCCIQNSAREFSVRIPERWASEPWRLVSAAK
jgi:DNA-directed RNA polymerase subunit RPC12/RpoP